MTGEPRLPRALLVALAAFITLLLLVGSLMPPAYKAVLHTRGRFHSWLHVVTFGSLAFVAARSTRSTPARMAWFTGVLVFGFAVELAEKIQFHGLLEWRDVLVDSIGISVATLLALLLDHPETLQWRRRGETKISTTGS